MSDINPNCDGSHCKCKHGEVRVYPIGGGGNLILCRNCFSHENHYNARRAQETKEPQNWPYHDWYEAKRYPEE